MSAGEFDRAAFDTLMPMHVLLDEAGRIVHAGPAFRRLAGDRTFLDRPALSVFEVSRPAGIETPADLMAATGRRLSLTLVEGRGIQFRGVLVPRASKRGALLNLALALSELADLGGAGLTNSDFSPTDMTVDMLYLIEAKSAAMSESRSLVSRLQGAKSAAEEQAVTDMLTGLRNRRALDQVLQQLLADGTPFALCRVDLDFFKAVNDTLGHAAGDLVLESVAATLREVTRPADTVARVGGDEFVLVFDDLTDRNTLVEIGRRLIAQLEEPVMFEGSPCRISASLGTAISTDYDGPTADQLMADADDALYASKEAGRARHTVFTPPSPTQNPPTPGLYAS